MKSYFIVLLLSLFVFPLFSQNGSELEELTAEINAVRILEDGTTTTDLSGEAPAEMRFYGGGSEAVDFYAWYIYKKTDLENHIVYYTTQDISYTFTESGDYLVRLKTSNIANPSWGVAEATEKFTIETSDLKIPNFLLLDGEHRFRVTYKSIISFKCVIFNRWGNKIYEFSDPSLGWDGKHNGRYVSPGVYFYVITAQGADGTAYRKGGDINVLKPK